MSEKAEALATQLEQANNDLIKTVDSLTDAQWNAICSGETWSVGVTAHHVAGGHPVIAGFVKVIASGQPMPPMTWEQLEQGNKQHATQFAGCTKAETLAMLRQNGQGAVAMLRGLSDEQLQLSGAVIGNQMTAEEVAKNILIGHVQQHTASIKQAI